MSDVERIAQAEIQMLAYEMHRAVEGIPFTAPECFVDFTRSAGAAITELMVQIRRRDAAIQAVAEQMHRERAALRAQGVQSGGDAMNDILVYGYDKCIELVESAIAAEMETGQ